MKLYIWDDPYEVSYGSSLLFVAAESLEQARVLAKQAKNGRFPDLDYYPPGVNVDKIQPSRVVDLPYAEYHEWSE